MRIPPVRAAVAAGAASAAALAAIGVTTSLASAASNGVVINEVYGGGGNSGATYTNDFIELANRSGGAASVAGWSVQYQPASGTSAWQVTPLTGSVGGNGGIYLV